MSKRKELTPLEKEYYSERRKVLRRIRDIRKRGYTVPINLAPSVPKDIRPESISRLKKYTTDYIYKRSVYTSPTGTIYKGTERRAQERSESSKKAAQTRAKKIQNDYYERQWHKITQDIPLPPPPQYSEEPTDDMYIIFYNVYKDFESWQPSAWWSDEIATLKQRDRDRGWGLLQGAINTLGEEAVARNLYNNSLRVIELENKIIYESGNKYREDSRNGEVNNALNEFQSILYGKPLSIRESIEFTSEAEASGSQ